MNKNLVKVILLGLIILAVLAPFAGLAPLLLVLLVAAVGSAVWSLVQAFLGNTDRDQRSA